MLPVDFKTAIIRKSFLLLLLWMSYVKSESTCPHGSYLHQNICYMPKFDLNSFTYDDALDNCAGVNGTHLKSWNADSMLFLRRLYWKTLRSYWVGIVDTAIEGQTMDLGYKNKCIASVIYNGSLAWKRLSCGYGAEYICEFQGSRLCGHSTMVGNKCYRLEHELRMYSSASDECKSKGGKLAEIKSVDEMRLIEEEIIHDRAWESVSEIELYKIHGQFPEIWLYSDTPDKPQCKTLKNWNSVNSSCKSYRPFICEIQGPHAVTTHSTAAFKSETNHTNSPAFTNDASTITARTQIPVSNYADFNAAPRIETTLSAEKLDYTLIVVVPVVACFVIALLVIILLVWFIRCAPNSKLRQSNVSIANRRKGSQGPVDADGYLIALEQKENSRNLRDEGYQHIPVYDATVDDSHYETID